MLGGLPMEKRDEALIAQLLKGNATLRQYVEEHRQYEKQLEAYDERRHLSAEEGMERKRIQKLKLAGRDRIERILAEYRRTKKRQRGASDAL
jgi:uncharacterized protein YdcH (DUF465 family)